MTGKARVSTLAKELGVTPQDVLGKLKELGEYVKSPASTLEPPVVRRLRECYPRRPHQGTARRKPAARANATTPFWRTAAERMNDEFDPLYAEMRVRDRRRKFYKGEEPRGLTKFLLDEHLVTDRPDDDEPPRTAYWANEVKDATLLASHWAPALLEGMSFEDILTWVSYRWVVVSAEDAVVLHHAGIAVHELAWSYEDKGLGTLADRLFDGRMTVEEVIIEAVDRRTRT